MKLLQSFFILLFLGAILILGSCSEKTAPVAKPVVEETQENTQNPDMVQQRTITGSLRSMTGVMDELSCYCDNGGYVITADGTITAVCFDEEVESCDKITVTGYLTSKSIQAHGSCPEGMLGFLKVQSYIVGETDY